MQTAKQFQRVLNAAAKASRQQADAQARLTEAMLARYGITHSDVDADEIIECLDYLGGTVTVEECDRSMMERGYPPLQK